MMYTSMWHKDHPAGQWRISTPNTEMLLVPKYKCGHGLMCLVRCEESLLWLAAYERTFVALLRPEKWKHTFMWFSSAMVESEPIKIRTKTSPSMCLLARKDSERQGVKWRGVVLLSGEMLESEGESTQEENEGGGANCDNVVGGENEDEKAIVTGKVLIKLALWWRVPVFVLKFILHRLPSILSSADRNCYVDPEQFGSSTTQFMPMILEAFGIKHALCIFWLSFFFFFFGGARYPQVAMHRS